MEPGSLNSMPPRAYFKNHREINDPCAHSAFDLACRQPVKWNFSEYLQHKNAMKRGSRHFSGAKAVQMTPFAHGTRKAHMFSCGLSWAGFWGRPVISTRVISSRMEASGDEKIAEKPESRALTFFIQNRERARFSPFFRVRAWPRPEYRPGRRRYRSSRIARSLPSLPPFPAI